MVQTAFTKMQGLGNDFVVVDRRAEGTPVDPAVAVRWCDRNFGIGADGVLSVLASPDAPVAMHVTNPDGSVAEMCGNGLRCVVRWAVERGLLPPTGGPVATGRGVLSCAVVETGDVRIDMGAPILEPSRVPTTLTGARVLDRPQVVADRTFAISAVSMGNPHAVTFLGADEDLKATALRYGPVLERDAAFPRRTNAGFGSIRAGGEIELWVWERGAGLTLACGTGACAAAVAAALTGRARLGEDVRVRLPGGALRVCLEPDLSRVWMTGPAVTVFDGSI